MTFRAFDLTGEKFTCLTALEKIGIKSGKALWKCQCDCGKITEVVSANLMNGKVKSCGCYARRNMLSKNCLTCKREFLVKKSYGKKAASYCCKFCMAEHYKLNQFGENNPNYRHGKSYTTEYRKPYVDAWKEANPERLSVLNRNAKLRRRSATGAHTWNDIQDKLFWQNNCCYWCLNKLDGYYEVDHVVPISRKGSNCKDNIVISCYECNRQKRNLFVTEWQQLRNCRSKRTSYVIGVFSDNF